MIKFHQLAIADVKVLIPKRWTDNRGWFMESYHKAECADVGIRADFVQDNVSFGTKANTVRGLHFQRPPAAQAKLVRVIHGSIFDVAVDLRRGSSTYLQWVSATLTAQGGEQLFVPRGFAHGFCTLEDDVEVAYKADAFYSKEHDAGILWNDPDIAIEWPAGAGQVTLSQRDSTLPLLREIASPFVA